MKTVSFDIDTLLGNAFPNFRRGKPFDAGQVTDTGIRQELDFEQVEGLDATEQANFLELRNTLNVYDHIGRPLFMPVKLGGYLLPNAPTLTIGSRKNIVETALVGSTRRGMVKELIAIEDWTLTLRGVAVNTDSQFVYPEDRVKRIAYLYERNEALEIESAITNLFGIYRVVVKSINFPEMIGVQHAQAYQIEMVSDEDFILEA